MTTIVNGLTVNTMLGDEQSRDRNFKILAMLWPNALQAAASNAPPGSPVAWKLYLVGAAGTGLFAGHNNDLAYHDGYAWFFIDPIPGQSVNGPTGTRLVWSGSAWA